MRRPFRSKKQDHRARSAPSRPRGGDQSTRSAATRIAPAFTKGRWAVGLHAVREALKVRPEAIAEIWMKTGWESSEDLREIAESCGKKVQVKPPGELDKLTSGHQGVAFRMSEDPSLDWSELEGEGPCLVLLADGLQDPHNLGAIIRTSWLLKTRAIFTTENRSSPMTPTVMKVASGGAEHVPVVPEGNLLDVAKRLKDMGFWLYGLAGEGRQTLWQTEFPGKVALVVGSEESGIRTPLSRLCDELVRIPQVEASASFNASVATAIALAEVSRQHQKA